MIIKFLFCNSLILIETPSHANKIDLIVDYILLIGFDYGVCDYNVVDYIGFDDTVNHTYQSFFSDNFNFLI